MAGNKNLKAMKLKEKPFTFTYLDRKGNELTSKTIDCYNKKEAINIAHKLQAESNLNDLHKIKTKKL